MSDVADLTRNYRAAFQRYLPGRSEAALTAGYPVQIDDTARAFAGNL